ncbi:MAG: hypothetical protein CMJ18_27400 [Phycisphaeraceae bacterium]|nr:hypothetical protein [Phycisphaeraceae bacterium]
MVRRLTIHTPMAAMILLSTPWAQGAVILDLESVEGPGSGLCLPFCASGFPGPNPVNNDNTDAPYRSALLHVTINEPRPVDIIYSVEPTGGTVEHRIDFLIVNGTTSPLADLTIQLGYGSADGFTPAGADGFDFDLPEVDPPASAGGARPVSHTASLIRWIDLDFPPGGTVGVAFHVDIPDTERLGTSGHLATFRVIPEPTAVPLLAILSWLLETRRKRNRVIR